MNRFACLAVGLVALGTSFGTFEEVAVAQPTMNPSANPSAGAPAAGTPTGPTAPAAPKALDGALRSSDKPDAARADIAKYIGAHMAQRFDPRLIRTLVVVICFLVTTLFFLRRWF